MRWLLCNFLFLVMIWTSTLTLTRYFLDTIQSVYMQTPTFILSRRSLISFLPPIIFRCVFSVLIFFHCLKIFFHCLTLYLQFNRFSLASLNVYFDKSSINVCVMYYVWHSFIIHKYKIFFLLWRRSLLLMKVKYSFDRLCWF